MAVTGYDVYRGTTLVGTSTSTSYTVTGLSAATAYSFTVRAKDAAGNVSAASTAVSATTQTGTVTDTTAPSVPTGLTAGTTTTTSVPLSWTASTDNVAGVAGYEVYRGSTLVGTTTSTSYTVTGLSAATAYSFTVRAKDARGQRLGRVLGGLGHHPDRHGHRHDGALGSDGSDRRHHHHDVGPAVLDRVHRQRGRHRLRRLPRHHPGGHHHLDELHRDRPVGRDRVLVHGPRQGRRRQRVLRRPVPSRPPRRPGTSTGACSVKYTASSWNTGFTASVKVTNTGTSALSSWSLGFSFANGQKVTQGWSADWSQSGTAVTAKNAAWNGTLGAGQSVDIGFNGSHSGTNNAPTAFTLNGATCTIA